MKIYINGKGGKRQAVEAELIKKRHTTIVVCLPDGHIITRKKKRDIVEEN